MSVLAASVVPSFLLLSQNVGNFESAIKNLSNKVEKRPWNEREPSKCFTKNDNVVEGTASSFLDLREHDDAMKFVLTTFVRELRSWILHLGRKLNREKQLKSKSDEDFSGAQDKEGRKPEDIHLVDIVVIHFQEIGGRTSYMPILKGLEELLVSKLLPESGWCSGLLVDSVAGFTALGTIIFVSKRLCPITSMLSIPHEVYVALDDDPCTYGGSSFNLYRAARFSEAGNSRKGFLLTSLRIGTQVVSFCNCHLYHDDSNEDAIAQTPSKYYKQREKGFLELVTECLKVVSKEDPFFIFGDFNTRLDGKSLVEYVKRVHQIQVVASPKGITCPSLFWNLFCEKKKANHIRQLFDIEPPLLMDIAEDQAQLHLAEMPVKFYPTFKFLASIPAWCPHNHCILRSEKELPKKGKLEEPPPHYKPEVGCRCHANEGAIKKEFSHTRIPAWCDRILFNSAAAHQFIFTPSARPPLTPSMEFHRLSVSTGDSQNDPQMTSSFHPGVDTSVLYNSFHLSFTDHNVVYLLF